MRGKIIILILLLPLKGLFAQLYVSNGITLSVAAGEMLYSAGDVTVATGGIFGNAGTLQLAGNLSCQSAATAMNNLVFSGTAAQQYLGQPLQASNLTIANTAGLTLDAPVTVAAATTFASGLIASSAASPLIYASGASTGTVTDASHVNGPVQYNGMGSFTYPVGNTSYYRSVGITLDGNASGLTATYFSSASPASPLTAPLQAVSQQEYWTLSPVGTASGTVTINWDNTKVGTGIPSDAGLAVLQVAHLSGGSWISEGGTASGTAAQGSITSANTISTWSPFALGSTDKIAAPLPLSFLDVHADWLPDGSRHIDWNTATEIQVRDYTVERSPDGRQFSGIGQVAASGTMVYSYVDAQPAAGNLLYYRVRGNDLDGRATYSRTVTVLMNGANAGISVTPDPVTDQMAISFGAGLAGGYTMQLLGIDGRLVYHAALNVSDGQRVTVARPSGLAAGTYLLRLRNKGGKLKTFKLIFK